jgi:DNA-binding LacI/PurR family transcriptional regulator
VDIVSFNDDPICTIVTPTLTSVAQPTLEMGKMAMSLLLNQIEKPDSIDKPEVKVFKTELKIRESSMRIK